MGKGQRARESRAQDKINNPQKYAAKKKKGKNYAAPLVIALAVVLIVVAFAYTYLNDNGILLRGKTVMKTDNFKVTGTMMQYATMTTYQNYVSQLGDYVSYTGLDTSKALADQAYGEDGGTWLDYFRDSAETMLSEMLVYAEAAKAAGVFLDENELDTIKENVDSIDSAALLGGYYSADAYIWALYGKGVTKTDIRDFYELSTLASKYEAQINDDAEAAVTAEELDAYYKEHMDEYSVADVITYSDTLTLPADLSDEEKSAKKAEFLAKFDSMKAALSEQEFKDALLAYLTEKATAEGTLDDEEAQSPETQLENALSTLSKDDIDNSKAADWVFELSDNAPVRQTGDIEIFTSGDEAADSTAEDETADSEAETTDDTASDTAEAEPAAQSEENTSTEPAESTDSTEIDASELLETEEAGAEDGSYTVEIYYIVKAPYADDDNVTKNVGHILFAFDSYSSSEDAKAAADAVYAEYLEGEKTKDSFEALAEKYTTDGSVFYDNVTQGYMVEPFNDWIYDEARQAGDTDIVETEYGYHVMYFVGDGYPVWKAECLTAITSQRLSDLFTEYQAKYVVTVDENAMKAVKG